MIQPAGGAVDLKCRPVGKVPGVGSVFVRDPFLLPVNRVHSKKIASVFFSPS